jgi:hypothetical protein
MALKKGLVHGDVFQGPKAFAFFNAEYPVHQQKGITVGQLLENLVNVHHGFSFVI